MEGPHPTAHPVAERTGALTHDRVLHEARAELLLGLALLLFYRRERWQEAARLEQHQARCEREERRDLVSGQRGERAHARQIRVGQIAQTHGEDVELLLLD